MSSLFENNKSLIEYFYINEKNYPDQVFLRQPYGDQWKEVSYKEAGQIARKMATALKSKGIKKGDHIALISKNCYHWILADIAVMMAEAISVPFYPNLTSGQLREVIEKSDSKLIFVGKLDEWQEKKNGVPADVPIIRFPHYEGNAKVSEGEDWDELVNKHEAMKDSPIPHKDDVWSILFTSGTTGSPKGVVHTHGSCALVARNEEINNFLKSANNKFPVYFSFLPLNHIAERTAVELGALLSAGNISFAENLDTFVKNLNETQPHLIFAVPRIWTKFQLGILGKMPQKKLDTLLKIPIVSSLIKKKIKKSLGLSRAEVALTGASITPESLKQWYRNLGINLREVYGMTENFGAFTLMPDPGHRPNTVGQLIPNAEGKIDPNTGEILMKMPWMMKGYYKDDELTAEVLRDGWLHTGDKGLMDKDGYFKIVGRVKDAFKTTKGEFIVPTTIEEHFFKNDFIEQICVTGLGIPQPVAMICLSDVAKSESKDIIDQNLRTQLDEVNKKLQNHERLSAIVIAKEQWSDANEMLTPTLKVKRGSVHDKYCDRLKAWCDAPEKIIWEA